MRHKHPFQQILTCTFVDQILPGKMISKSLEFWWYVTFPLAYAEMDNMVMFSKLVHFNFFWKTLLLNLHTWKLKGKHHPGDSVLGCFHAKTPAVFMESTFLFRVCFLEIHSIKIHKIQGQLHMTSWPRFVSKCILSSQATPDLQNAIFMRICKYPPMPGNNKVLLRPY